MNGNTLGIVYILIGVILFSVSIPLYPSIFMPNVNSLITIVFGLIYGIASIVIIFLGVIKLVRK